MKAALALVLVLTLAACGSSAAMPKRMGAHLLPDRAGKPVTDHLLGAQVLVVAYPNGKVRICGVQTSDLMFGPPACPTGPRALGVRIDALHSRSSTERWGYLYLVGVYRNGTFTVTSQRNRPPRGSAPTPSSLATPPCARPRGGWRLVAPTEAQRDTIGKYERTHRGDLVSIAFFHDDTILTVASAHPKRTRVLLGRTWPRQLCVVRARYSRPLVNQVRSRLIRFFRLRPLERYGWINGAGGDGVSGRGQPTVSLDVLIETPGLRALLRHMPPGLVVVQPTFERVRSYA